MDLLTLSSSAATIKNLNNGYCSFILNNPIMIPQNSYVACPEFTYTNSFLNISSALGNNVLTYIDTSGPSTYTITIPDGSYSFDELNVYLVNMQLSQSPNVAVFELSASYATNKVGFLFDDTNTGYYIDLTAADAPYEILGFLVTDQPGYNAGAGAGANELVYGTNSAAFNNVSLVKLSTSLTSEAYSNLSKGGVLAQSAPSVSPGSVEVYKTFQFYWVRTPGQALVSKIDLQILDQNDNPLLMREDFGCTIVIRTTGF